MGSAHLALRHRDLRFCRHHIALRSGSLGGCRASLCPCLVELLAGDGRGIELLQRLIAGEVFRGLGCIRRWSLRLRGRLVARGDRGGDLGLRLLNLRFGLLFVGLGLGQLSLGSARLYNGEQCAGGDFLVVDIGHLDQRTAYLRRDPNDVGIDEGVVGRFVLARVEVVENASDQQSSDNDRQNDPENWPLEQRRLGVGLLLIGCIGGIRIRDGLLLARRIARSALFRGVAVFSCITNVGSAFGTHALVFSWLEWVSRMALALAMITVFTCLRTSGCASDASSSRSKLARDARMAIA